MESGVDGVGPGAPDERSERTARRQEGGGPPGLFVDDGQSSSGREGPAGGLSPVDRGPSSGLDGPGTEEPRDGVALRCSPRFAENGDREGRRCDSELRVIPTDGGYSRGEGNVEGHREGGVRTGCIAGLELGTTEEGAWMSAADREDKACKIM